MHRALVLSVFFAAAACGKEPADIPVEQTASHATRRDVVATIHRPSALAAVDLEDCRTAGTPKGQGHVKITYDTDGKATKAEVDDPTFANTHTGWCVADRFLHIARLDPTRYGAASAETAFEF